MNNTITVLIKTPVSLNKVWEFYTDPKHITSWNNASDDWECPKASNQLTIGGRFCYRMSSKDKTMSFDFEGIFTKIVENELLEYTLCVAGSDPIPSDRNVKVEFSSIIVDTIPTTIVKVSFDPENENSEELQKRGWQSILNNFKKYSQD